MGRLDTGDKILFATFGGGFTWGSALCRWVLPKPENPISFDD